MTTSYIQHGYFCEGMNCTYQHSYAFFFFLRVFLLGTPGIHTYDAAALPSEDEVGGSGGVRADAHISFCCFGRIMTMAIMIVFSHPLINPFPSKI